MGAYPPTHLAQVALPCSPPPPQHDDALRRAQAGPGRHLLCRPAQPASILSSPTPGAKGERQPAGHGFFGPQRSGAGWLESNRGRSCTTVKMAAKARHKLFPRTCSPACGPPPGTQAPPAPAGAPSAPPAPAAPSAAAASSSAALPHRSMPCGTCRRRPQPATRTRPALPCCPPRSSPPAAAAPTWPACARRGPSTTATPAAGSCG